MKIKQIQFLLVAFLLALACGNAEARKLPLADGLESYQPWSEEVVELFRGIPVQDDGRVKPLETVARFKLYRINGKRSVKFGIEKGDDVEKIKISAVEWYLDCLFRPDIAKQLPFILVDNTGVLVDIGLVPDGAEYGAAAQRDRISYNELIPALPNPEDPNDRGRLSEKRKEFLELKEKDGKAFAKETRKIQLLALHDRVAVLNYLIHMMDFARGGLLSDVSLGQLSPKLGNPEDVNSPLSEWLEKWNKIPGAVLETGKFDLQGTRNLMDSLAARMEGKANVAGADTDNPIAGIAMFAPTKDYDDDWTNIGEEIVKAANAEEEPYTVGIERVKLFEQLAASTGEQANFLRALKPFVKERVSEAKVRDEYRAIPLELKYYDGGYLHRALPWFIFALVFVALSWLSPGSEASRYLGWASAGTCALALGYVIAAMVMRCLIMQRPPISTLYETILFITASAVLLCLMMEYVNRKKVALAVAALLGAGGMFLAMRFEMKEALDGKGDSMVTLQAVLRSNFWLGTHVIIINLGYASGLLGAGLSMVYLVSRLTRGGAPDNESERDMTRMVYGIVCFTLLFSLVGTVLGGIWANDSWGRFWGWDPKENGALMIVLWSLVILHARMGGYIKRVGIHVNSIILGMITVFSWWHVNELGVGLHSYGATSGVMKILYIVYGIGVVFIMAGAVVWMLEREAEQSRLAAKGGRAAKASS